MTAKTTLYDRDFYAWSREQAELLRAGFRLTHYPRFGKVAPRGGTC